MDDGTLVAIDQAKEQIQLHYEDFSRQGFRTLGLAYKPMDKQSGLDKTDETTMRFLGFLVFFDPPKAGCTETIKQLRELGVTLKIITGDNHLVAATLTIIAITLVLPYTPVASLVGFVPLPLSLIGMLGVIVVLYLSTAEIAKHIFYRRVRSQVL